MNKVISGCLILCNNELWLSQSYILETTNISYSYIRVACIRFNIRHIKVNGIKYLAYDYLPNDYKEKLLPKKQLVAKAILFFDDIVYHIILKANFDSYKLFSNNSFERAFACAIIHEASIYVERYNIPFSKSAFFEKLANELELRQVRYLPKTWRNLRDRIKEYHNSTNMQL